jgi:hypothetical protein
VKTAADTMRPNPKLDIAGAIGELAVGEALVSFLDAQGRPSVTERVFVLPPGSQIGPISAAQRTALREGSLVAGVYEKAVDRVSAYETLKGRVAASPASRNAPVPAAPDAGIAPDWSASAPAPAPAPAPGAAGGVLGSLGGVLFGTTGPRGGRHEGIVESAARSAMRSIGSSVGREIIRGVLGSIMGGSRRR